MNQAENYIEEDFDDYAYDSNYDLYDSLDCDDVCDMTDRSSRFIQRHILPGLHPLIEEIRANNGKAKMGGRIEMPYVRKKVCQEDLSTEILHKRL